MAVRPPPGNRRGGRGDPPVTAPDNTTSELRVQVPDEPPPLTPAAVWVLLRILLAAREHPDSPADEHEQDNIDAN